MTPSLPSSTSGPPLMGPTLLFLHAHPDDECILTGSTIAKAAANGCRVIVAYATRGDAGETSADLGGRSLGEVREAEARAACASLGVDDVVFLGFEDSGMEDSETSTRAEAFCNVPLDEATRAVVAAVAGEPIDAVVGYDRNGTYGHPDHVRIHELAHACAPELDAAWVLDATYNRDHLAEMNAGDSDDGYDKMNDDFEGFATAETELTHLVQGLDWFLEKATAIRHHWSQMPDEWRDPETADSPGAAEDNPTDEDETNGQGPDMSGFAAQFGIEWYVATPVAGETDLGGLAAVFEPKASWTGEALVLPPAVLERLRP